MTASKLNLTEARPQLVAEATDTEGRYLVQLINPGWGSSGFYSGDVLSEAATRKVFPAGLHMYADHPSASEAVDRPERSVRDLWAVLESDAVAGADGTLVAEMRVFTPYRPLVEEMKDSIGLSIRAGAFAETGEADGRQGTIITSIDEALSVDFVTAAGRGGKILEVIESARVEAKPDVAATIAIQPDVVEAFPGGFTANDLRDALCSAVSEEHGGEKKYAWVRDYTDTQVIFELDGDGDRGNYRQSYTVDGSTVTLTDDREEVTPKTTWEPVTESSTTTDPGPGTGTGPAEPPADTKETDMTESTGAGGSAPTPRQVIENELASLRRVAAQSMARDRAREIVTQTLSEAWLPGLTVARLTDQLLETSRLPINGEDKLDEHAVRASAVKARDLAERELAEVMQASGMGSVRDLGATLSEVDRRPSGVDLETKLTESFRELGMTDSAATLAAKGR